MKLDHPLVGAYEACMSTYEESRKLRQSGRHFFAGELKKTRNILKLSCRQLGSAIGVTGQLISQIETTAKSILSREQVQKIVDLCSNEKHPSVPSQDSKNVEES
jgi:DNA-binding XRE family transcriptional regulator